MDIGHIAFLNHMTSKQEQLT